MSLKSAEKTGTNEVTLALCIDAQTFEAAANKAYHREKNKINIPGFRKGKAPRAFMEKLYGKNTFYDYALEDLFAEVYEAAVAEAGIKPVDDPHEYNILSSGAQGLEMTCKVTVRPEITLEGYRALRVEKPLAGVSAEEIEKELSKKLEESARLVSVEDRAAKTGDTVVLDFEGFVDGVAFEGGSGEDYTLELGEGDFIPGFEEQIEGHSVGEAFDINVTFPDDYDGELAGKEAVFKCTLNLVQEKILPEADDEFAKDVSEFDTLDDLKADIEETLRERKEAESKKAFENEVFDKLAELVTDEIPDIMVEKKTEEGLSNFKYRLQSQGIPLEMYLQYFEMDMETMREHYREGADRDVRLSLALEKIAELEDFEITEDDIEAAYQALSLTCDTDLETVKKMVSTEEITVDIKNIKAREFVFACAAGEEPEKPAASGQKEEEPEAAPVQAPAKKAAPKKTKKETPAPQSDAQKEETAE